MILTKILEITKDYVSKVAKAAALAGALVALTPADAEAQRLSPDEARARRPSRAVYLVESTGIDMGPYVPADRLVDHAEKITGFADQSRPLEDRCEDLLDAITLFDSDGNREISHEEELLHKRVGKDDVQMQKLKRHPKDEKKLYGNSKPAQEIAQLLTANPDRYETKKGGNSLKVNVSPCYWSSISVPVKKIQIELKEKRFNKDLFDVPYTVTLEFSAKQDVVAEVNQGWMYNEEPTRVPGVVESKLKLRLEAVDGCPCADNRRQGVSYKNDGSDGTIDWMSISLMKRGLDAGAFRPDYGLIGYPVGFVGGGVADNSILDDPEAKQELMQAFVQEYNTLLGLFRDQIEADLAGTNKDDGTSFVFQGLSGRIQYECGQKGIEKVLIDVGGEQIALPVDQSKLPTLDGRETELRCYDGEE